MMRRTNGILFLAALGLLLEYTLSAPAASRRDGTLLVVPARPRVIQLALDMVHLRSAAVVSCHGAAQATEPVLHVWTGTEWQYVSMPDFSDNKFLSTPPQRVIFIGDDRTVPSVLLQSVAWCGELERLETLNVAELINGLDRTFHFKAREWKWLANRYGLTLLDLNAECRKINPYDTPRSKLPLETREFKQGKGDLAPAQLIEEKSAVVPPASAAKPTAQPAEKPPK